MCGIFGFIGPGFEYLPSEITSLLSHRGPDAFGTYQDKHNEVFFAHNRLSIIDLSTFGQQPMCNENKTIWLTYNGEIYNFAEIREKLIKRGHIFRSQTDSEVIIHAYEEWDTECLNRFNGMFAFGLWDKNKKQLFLVRDRLGIKPLYYAQLSKGFAFASEPKSIISLPFYNKKIHYPALLSYLIYRYIAEDNSIWEGIKKLKPGHYALYNFEKKKFAITQYWQIPIHQKKWSEHNAIDRLEELLSSSVRYRLIGDVPMGIFLSGGIDSSSITLEASKFSPQIKTFCIGFKDTARSELKDARLVADLLATTHYEDVISTENFIPILKKIFYYFDEPLGDSSIIPTYLLCREAKKYVTVALSGDGADELFGGYNWYTLFKKYRPFGFLSALLGPLSHFLPITGFFSHFTHPKWNEFHLYRSLTSPRFEITEIKKLFPSIPEDDYPITENYLLKTYHKTELEPIKRWQYIDALTFMTDDILVKIDRTAMANSLEVRVPFLDHRMVEFSFSLPDDLCLKNSQKKYLLKKYLGDKIPKFILNKPKQGFSCPVSKFWPHNKMIKSVNIGRLLKNGILSRDAWKELEQNSNIPQWQAKIFLIAMLEGWCEKWMDN